MTKKEIVIKRVFLNKTKQFSPLNPKFIQVLLHTRYYYKHSTFAPLTATQLRMHFSAWAQTRPSVSSPMERTALNMMIKRSVNGHKDHQIWLWFFFLWGIIKNKVYQPPLPEIIDDLKEDIRRAMRSRACLCSSRKTHPQLRRCERRTCWMCIIMSDM